MNMDERIRKFLGKVNEQLADLAFEEDPAQKDPQLESLMGTLTDALDELRDYVGEDPGASDHIFSSVEDCQKSGTHCHEEDLDEFCNQCGLGSEEDEANAPPSRPRSQVTREEFLRDPGAVARRARL